MKSFNPTMLVTSMLLTACAADLGVYDSNEKKVPGVPVNTPIVYVISGDFTAFKKKNTKCQQVAAPPSFQSLPVGDRYFIDPEPGFFYDAEFKVDFSDNGSLKSVVLNSETNLPKTIDAITNLLEKGLPAVGFAPAVADTADVRRGDQPACDTGLKVTKIERLQDYIRRING
jgi:hypothetical protein